MPKRMLPALMGILAGSVVGLTAPPAPAARADSSSYTVEGITLGDRVERSRDFRCEPGERSAEFNWCQRTRQDRGKRGPFSSTLAFLQNPSGTAVYVSRSIEPAFFGTSDIESEIARLSGRFGERPREVNLPERDGLPAGTIALWGKLKLEPLDPATLSSLGTSEPSRQNLLVDHLGDLKRSALAGLPVYRLGGGAGFLWSASASADGRGHLRFLAIDPAGVVAKLNPVPIANEQPKTTAPNVEPRKVVGPYPAVATLSAAPEPQELSNPPSPVTTANTTVRAKTRPDYTVPTRPASMVERAELEPELRATDAVTGDQTGSIRSEAGKAPPPAPAPHRMESMIALIGAAAILLFFLASMIERLLRVREPTGLELLEMQWQRELAEEQAEQGGEQAVPEAAAPWFAMWWTWAHGLVGSTATLLHRALASQGIARG